MSARTVSAPDTLLRKPIDLPHGLTRVLLPVLTRTAGLVFI